MSKYKIYGDYGYTNETLLEEFDTLSEAVEWAENYVDDDFGGYMMVEVAWHDLKTGEYVVERRYDCDEEGILFDEL